MVVVVVFGILDDSAKFVLAICDDKLEDNGLFNRDWKLVFILGVLLFKFPFVTVDCSFVLDWS